MSSARLSDVDSRTRACTIRWPDSNLGWHGVGSSREDGTCYTGSEGGSNSIPYEQAYNARYMKDIGKVCSGLEGCIDLAARTPKALRPLEPTEWRYVGWWTW